MIAQVLGRFPFPRPAESRQRYAGSHSRTVHHILHGGTAGYALGGGMRLRLRPLAGHTAGSFVQTQVPASKSRLARRHRVGDVGVACAPQERLASRTRIESTARTDMIPNSPARARGSDGAGIGTRAGQPHRRPFISALGVEGDMIQR